MFLKNPRTFSAFFFWRVSSVGCCFFFLGKVLTVLAAFFFPLLLRCQARCQDFLVPRRGHTDSDEGQDVSPGFFDQLGWCYPVPLATDSDKDGKNVGISISW